MHLPADLARAVEAYAGAFAYADLASAAAAISRRYRSERPRTGRLSPVECAAWAAVRMPATWAATHAVLAELRFRDPEAQPRSVLDLGSGPGGGIHAAAEVFPSIDQATAMDCEPGLIALGRTLSPPFARWEQRDIRTGPPFPVHHVVLIAWVLGELEVAEREALIARAWAAADKFLLIIEPGTPEGFQTVRHARERLYEEGANLVAPCPSAQACAAPDGEWCHFAARLERSALHRRLKAGELSYEDEKFSYLIASRSPLARATGRIVRHPRHEPGLVQLEICTGHDWQSLNIRRRDREQFRRARKARWGDEWIVTG